MNSAYLLLGGNIGDREKTLQKTISEVEKHIGKILKKSSVYETKAWGFEEQNDFLNQAILVETKFSAEELMEKILEIEKTLGRKKTEKKWRERIIDIDILFFNLQIFIPQKCGTNLQIAHPYLHLRKFDLLPLNEIAPDLVHLVLKKTISELLQQCADNLTVKKLHTNQ